MNYADIVKALPKNVADSLQVELDKVNITDTMSQAEVRELAEDAVKLTRLKIVIADDETRRSVDSLLSFVAQSVVSVVFA
jgi:hypothetical protein